MSTTTDEKILANNNDDKNGRSDDLISEPDKKSSTLKDFCGLSIIQSKIVSWGITSIAVCAIAILVALIAILGDSAVKLLAPAIAPLVIGLFLSFIFLPLFRLIRDLPSNAVLWLRNRVPWFYKSLAVMWHLILMPCCFCVRLIPEKRRNKCKERFDNLINICVFLLILGVILAAVTLLAVKLGKELGQGIQVLAQKDWSTTYQTMVLTLKQKLPFIQKVNEWVSGSVATDDTKPSFLIEFVKNHFMQFVQVFLAGLRYLCQLNTWLFAIFFCYCFLTHPLSGEKIVNHFKEPPTIFKFSEETWSFVAKQLDEFCNTMTVYFPKQILINLLEGLLGGWALARLGLPCGFPLGFLMGFMNIIPLFGTFLMLPVVLTVAYCAEIKFDDVLQDPSSVTGYAFGIWAGVSLLMDQLLPHIVHGDKMNLSSGAIVFSFLFWGALIDPVWGMILAIPLSAFVKGLWFSLSEYIKETQNTPKRIGT